MTWLRENIVHVNALNVSITALFYFLLQETGLLNSDNFTSSKNHQDSLKSSLFDFLFLKPFFINAQNNSHKFKLP